MNGFRKFLAWLVPAWIAEVLTSEAVMEDRRKAEENAKTASAIRNDLFKNYAQDVDANRRLTIYVFGTLDPSGELAKGYGIQKEGFVQDTAVAYLMAMRRELNDLKVKQPPSD